MIEPMTDQEYYELIADHMEKGFLENIKDMFRHDPALFAFLPRMIGDERMGVRIGAAALAEDMRQGHMDELRAQVPAIAGQLRSDNPTLRGDAVYLLSSIGHPDALPYIKARLASGAEDHPGVLELLRDTLQELEAQAL